MEMAESPGGIELSVVIPIYNGANSISPLVQALASLNLHIPYEIILVEDGGPDNAAEVGRELVTGPHANPQVILVELARNYGEHNAVMAGLRLARGRFVITMDDDLQNPPEEMVRLYEACRDSDADVVYTYYEEKKHSPFRNLGSWLANKTADLMLDKPRNLYLSTFRCMRSNVVREVTRYDGPFPYVDGLITQVTNRYGKLKVEHYERAEGRSGYTLRKLIRLWLTIAINFSTLPLRAATMFGFGLTIFGVLVTGLAIVERLFLSVEAGWTSVIAAVLIFSGAQLVVLGVMGEYVGRIFLHMNKKPQYTVRAINR